MVLRGVGRGVWQLFSYPFRIFFLSLAVLSVFWIPSWVAVASGPLTLPLALPGYYWHQHEMVFAFLHAAIAGFLLTAVCVWTGTQRTHGHVLLAIWLVWLAGRVIMAVGDGLPGWLTAGVNLAFLPLIMADAGWRIWQARQKRQIVVLAVLGLLWVMQLGFFMRPQGAFIDAALVLAMTLMLVIGGRITPNFSMAWLRNHGLSTQGIRIVPALEWGVLASMGATLLAVLSGNGPAIAATALVAGAVSLTRIVLWRGWRVRSEPLLWILHISMLWIPAALWLLAGSAAGWWPATVWVHAIAVGGMGGLILGVISRVALGHTGRALQLPRGMATAFAAVHLAAITRVAAGFGVIPWQTGLGIAGALWIAAYGLFLVRYIPILTAPRVDGRPG
ncbi:NnrS family protein [Aquisalimonas lutea]|uniref:NnrS family protein n=1 Tax=Aquisalimonas lutea TaxID=1327750 RepID=UPI0025B5CF87|nr:NnrS family protein [Aquisalimonas lutea]MDN3519453.1 NnrS family protein [Aquisalimonas lutea]